MKLFIEFFRFAYQNMLRSKLRTSLTILSIVIGISTIVVIAALSEGNNKALTDFMNQEGKNLLKLTVETRNVDRSSSDEEASDSDTQPKIELTIEEHTVLTTKKALRIKALVPHVLQVSPEIVNNVRLVIDQKRHRANAVEVFPDYFLLREIKLLEGRNITEFEMQNSARVCVLAMTPSMINAWAGQPILGSKVSIKKHDYLVIGLSEFKSNSNIMAENVAYVPFNSISNKPIANFNELYFKINDQNNLKSAKIAIMKVIEMWFPGLTEIDVENPAEDFASEQEMLNQVSLILGGIAGISLLVGGIGIMNIMMVSVIERKKEIGIKKAIGASKAEILIEFVIETILLCFVGGIVGVVLGILLATIAANMMDMPSTIPIVPAAIGLGFSLIIAMAAGIFPSYKAAKLDPIDALGFS